VAGGGGESEEERRWGEVEGEKIGRIIIGRRD